MHHAHIIAVYQVNQFLNYQFYIQQYLIYLYYCHQFHLQFNSKLLCEKKGFLNSFAIVSTYTTLL